MLIIGIIGMFYYLFSQETAVAVAGGVLSSCAIGLNAYYISKAIKRLYPKHGGERFSWSMSGFEKDGVEKLKMYFNRKDLDENATKILQELLKGQAAKERVNSVIFLSCFAALFVPLWSVYLDHVFDVIKDVAFMSKTFIVGIFLIFSLSYLMTNLADFRDTVFTRFMKFNRLSDLISLIWISKNE